MLQRFPIVSLFSGAGGLDLGIEKAGKGLFETVAWVENDPDCRETLVINHSKIKNSESFFTDIRDLDPKQILINNKLSKGETFLVAGGPPCQAFSTAGLRHSVKSEKGDVVHNYFDIIKHMMPRFFVFENVRGLLSAAISHVPLAERQERKGESFSDDEKLGSVMSKIVLPAFNRLGYEVVYGILCSADYGTAQIRHRVFLLGSRDKEFKSGAFRKQTSRRMDAFDLIPPTHHRFAPYKPIRPWRTLRDAIWDLRNDLSQESYTYSPERALIFSKIPAGTNWKYVRDNPKLFPKKYLEDIMGGAISSGGGKEGFWRRLSWDSPAPTLTTQPQQLASSLCHPDFERPLSIKEYARLQDFPDSYVFSGSKSAQYRQIGNAVPVKLAFSIGSFFLHFAKE